MSQEATMPALQASSCKLQDAIFVPQSGVVFRCRFLTALSRTDARLLVLGGYLQL